MNRLCLRVPIALLVFAASFAQAQSPAGLPAWEQLSQAQREELVAPIRERWNREPAARARMLEHARRWKSMSPEERSRARRGMHRWEHMDTQKRAKARALFESMRHLPDAERRALRERWKQMTPEQRRQWIEAHQPPPAR